jgi:hypothetical protein
MSRTQRTHFHKGGRQKFFRFLLASKDSPSCKKGGPADRHARNSYEILATLLFLFRHLATLRLRLLNNFFLQLPGHDVVVMHFHVE